METKKHILKCLKDRGAISGTELAAVLGISRQAVNRHLRDLVQDGKVTKEGATKGARYRLSGSSPSAPGQRVRKRYPLRDLEEDRVLREVDARLRLRDHLSRKAWEITSYAFTEMVNNAIDHSRSPECRVDVELDAYLVRFCVRDFGIGVFESIAAKLGLPDAHAAVGELVKGKTTTMPERHSGEGIFFTSKVADMMSFRSHRTELVFDNNKKDVFVHEKRYQRGTEVVFELKKGSRRDLSSVFSKFAPEAFDYRFEKTRVQVKLFEEDYISRSEARRLLTGLDRFSEVVLDFKGVTSIGQAFADEVFQQMCQILVVTGRRFADVTGHIHRIIH